MMRGANPRAIIVVVVVPAACGGAMPPPPPEPTETQVAATASAPPRSSPTAPVSAPASQPASPTASASYSGCGSAVQFGWQRLYGSANRPTATDLGDLNGDGRSEVVLAVPNLDPGGTHTFYVLAPEPAPVCFRVVLDGNNVPIVSITVASTSTHGWKDLTVTELMSGVGHGGQTTPDHKMPFVGTYDGQRYSLLPDMR